MKQVGKIFGAPIVVEGRTWFPFVPLITWGITAWLAGRRNPKRTPAQRIATGAVTMPLVIGAARKDLDLYRFEGSTPWRMALSASL